MTDTNRGRGRRKRPNRRKGQQPPRPSEWVQAELDGVLAWLSKLENAEEGVFPAEWRKGQLRHYKARATTLRKELRASKRREKGE